MNKILLGLLATSMVFASCNTNQQNQESNQKDTVQKEERAESKTTDNAAYIKAIDSLRAAIESEEVKPVEISTAGLREKIKQKWSKLHFYVKDQKVVKVKTYPHASVSKRTEEFYANEKGLVLVVIEDNGSGPKGKEKGAMDKMYYFENGKVVKEAAKGEEEEYNIKNSDAEELLTEFKEYLDTYNKTIGK